MRHNRQGARNHLVREYAYPLRIISTLTLQKEWIEKEMVEVMNAAAQNRLQGAGSQ